MDDRDGHQGVRHERVRLADHVGPRRHAGRRHRGRHGAAPVRSADLDVRGRRVDRGGASQRRDVARGAARRSSGVLGGAGIPVSAPGSTLHRSRDAAGAGTARGPRRRRREHLRHAASDRCAVPAVAAVAVRGGHRLRSGVRGQVGRGNGAGRSGPPDLSMGDDAAASGRRDSRPGVRARVRDGDVRRDPRLPAGAGLRVHDHLAPVVPSFRLELLQLVGGSTSDVAVPRVLARVRPGPEHAPSTRPPTRTTRGRGPGFR